MARAGLRIRIKNDTHSPISCASCLTRPIEACSDWDGSMFCQGCSDLIQAGEIRARRDRGTLVYEGRTDRARRWLEAGWRKFDETYQA